MRFAIAIAVLALSGIAFILGIGQRTVFAPPAEVAVDTIVPVDAEYAVIPAEVFDAEEGIAGVVVRGAGAFAAVGSQRDVAGWIAAVDHAEVSVLPDLEGLAFDEIAGEAVQGAPAEGEPAEDPAVNSGEMPLDPRGSDLWVVERSAPESSAPEVRLPAELNADESMLVAVTGSDGLGQSVSVVWEQDQRTPWAGPLLVTGGVLAIVGGVLYLLALDHNRRGLGPRRGRSGPLLGIRGSISRRRESRKAKRVIAPVAVLVGALALSGCSADYWPDFSPSEEAPVTTPDQGSTLAPVPITAGQIDRIIEDVAAVAEAGDLALDPNLIEARFTGDALAQRTASYTIRAAVPDYDLVPPHISAEQLGYVLVQSTEGWPRTIFIAVASHQPEDRAAAEAVAEEAAAEEAAAEGETVPDDAASPSLALVMTQASPHDNYEVSRTIALRGGIAMPEAAPAEEGTALLSPNLQTLVLPPGEVGAAFAAVLQGGPEVEEASLFDLGDDPLIAKSGLAWVQQTQEKAAAEGYSVQYSVTTRVGDEPMTALSTGVGGGLVAVTVIEERVSDTAGSTTRVRAEGAVSALSGLSGQQERIVSEVAHQLLFFVPSKSSGDKIQLLGATSELVGARN